MMVLTSSLRRKRVYAAVRMTDNDNRRRSKEETGTADPGMLSERLWRDQIGADSAK